MADVNNKPECQYGLKCYRKNPAHFAEFSHPEGHSSSNESNSSQENDSFSNPGPSKRQKIDNFEHENAKFVENRLNRFNFYFTKVRGIDQKWNSPHLAMDISDILSIDSDKFERSVQFNYMIDFSWLLSKFPKINCTKPLLIVMGNVGVEQRADCHHFPQISLLSAKLPVAYGTHHTKMMILYYTTGVRVVIHTANLIEQDWDQKTQGIYLSPLFPKITSGDTFNDSESKFGTDLIDYLKSYNIKQLDTICNDLKQYDFSSAKVSIVASTPGRHSEPNLHKWGHLKLRNLLKMSSKRDSPSSARDSKNSEDQPDKSWPVIGQFSSIGSLGSTADNWLTGEFKTTLAECGRNLAIGPPLNLVFPSVDNVRLSLEGYPAGASLPYSIKTAVKQTYFNNFLHKWRSDMIGRSRASPHIKTYFRTNSNFTKLSWFLITSANLSKAAWGVLEKNKTQLMIRSYELGVLFLPQYFNPNKNYFNLQSGDEKFLLPIDLPLTKYYSQDKPWTWDSPHTEKPDSHGNMWQPS